MPPAAKASSPCGAAAAAGSSPATPTGCKVLLADFDIEQRTCMRWQAQRQARRLEPAIDVEKFSKEAKLDRVSHRYDDVILDTPGLMRR